MVNNKNILGMNLQRNMTRNVGKRNNGKNNLVIRNVSGKTSSVITYVTLVYCVCIILASIVMLILGNEVWSKSTVESDGTRRFSKYDFKIVNRVHVVYPGNEGFIGGLDIHISAAQKEVDTAQQELNSKTYTINNNRSGTDLPEDQGITINDIDNLISKKEVELVGENDKRKKDNLNLLIIHLKEELKKVKLQSEVSDEAVRLQTAQEKLNTLTEVKKTASAGTFDKLKSSMSLRTYNVILVIILVFHLGLALLLSSKL